MFLRLEDLLYTCGSGLPVWMPYEVDIGFGRCCGLLRVDTLYILLFPAARRNLRLRGDWLPALWLRAIVATAIWLAADIWLLQAVYCQILQVIGGAVLVFIFSPPC